MIEATTRTQARPKPQTQARTRRWNWARLLLGAHTLLMYIFLYTPILILVVFSFTRDTFGVRWTGFTLHWYARLLQDQRLVGGTINTLKVALISTVVSTIIGTLTALAMERYRFRGRTAFDGLLYLPIVIPEIVMGLALMVFFSFSFGLIDNITGRQPRMSLATVIISHIAFSISFVTIVVRASLKGFDRRLEEAAQDLGANQWQILWHITLPLILPGVIGGALLAFTMSLDDFIISFFTSGPGTSLLPIEVYSQVKRAVTPKINAISTVMLLISMALVGLSLLVQRGRSADAGGRHIGHHRRGKGR